MAERKGKERRGEAGEVVALVSQARVSSNAALPPGGSGHRHETRAVGGRQMRYQRGMQGARVLDGSSRGSKEEQERIEITRVRRPLQQYCTTAVPGFVFFFFISSPHFIQKRLWEDTATFHERERRSYNVPLLAPMLRLILKIALLAFLEIRLL